MNKKYRMLSGPLAYLLPMMFRSFLPPDEGGGGGVEKPEENAALNALFGLVEDKPEEPKPGDEPEKPGMSLQAAIAEPSAEDKAAQDKAATDKKAAEDKEAADKKAAEDKAAAEKKAAEDPAPDPIKVRKTKSAGDVAAEEKQRKDREEATAREQSTKDWEASLLDEERDQLELARVAERKDPVKYKGLVAKTEKFIRDNAAKTEATDFDPDGDDYKAWVNKERPSLSNAEVRALERARGEEIATKRVTEESGKVLDTTFRMIEEPRVKAEADAYFAKAVSEAMPDEVAKALKEDSKKASEAFSFEIQIAQGELSTHADVVEELLALTRKNPSTGRMMKPYDEANPLHGQVVTLISQVEDGFKKTGGAELVKDGKRFLSRTELARVPEAERGRYWTFTPAEIAARSTGLVKQRIAAKISSENDRMRKLGFERKAAAAPQAPASSSAPAPRPSPLPSASSDSGSESASDRLLRDMGMLS